MPLNAPVRTKEIILHQQVDESLVFVLLLLIYGKKNRIHQQVSFPDRSDMKPVVLMEQPFSLQRYIGDCKVPRPICAN